ncbi:MAG: hypothetical protein GC137_09350 [Alphaproteobacteria bacterium]|nr:hypothetical protein [Alphaproteobacteria bacterium]
MAYPLPKHLTSYDLLKALAVILMIIDHVGFHFYPDEMWFRVAGRICLPMWFFLIGYADTKDSTKEMWLGATVLLLSSMIAGQFFLPLNILFTMILFRRARRKGYMRCLLSGEALRGMFFLCLVLSYPSAALFEYGTAAFLFVIFGYIVRNKQQVVQRIELIYLKLFAGLSFFSFFIIQGISMPTVDYPQAGVMLLGYAASAVGLWHFKSIVFEDATRYMAGTLIRFLQFMGRHTLLIYVVHLIILRILSMYYFPDRFAFMQWQIVPENMVSMLL